MEWIIYLFQLVIGIIRFCAWIAERHTKIQTDQEHEHIRDGGDRRSDGNRVHLRMGDEVGGGVVGGKCVKGLV